MRKSILAASLFMSFSVFAAPQNPVEWTMASIEDDFTDEVLVSAEITTNEGQGAFLLCYDKSVQLAVGSSAYAGAVKVYTTKYRVDKNKPKVAVFKAVKRFHYMINSNYVDDFKKGNKAILQLKNIDDGTVNVKFNLRGFTKAYNQVKAACK